MNVRIRENLKTKSFWRLSITLLVLCAFYLVFYLLYTNVKEDTIQDFNNEQLILAKTASKGIYSYLDNYENYLSFIAKHESFIDFSEKGKESMEFFYESHKNVIKAISRIDSTGIILHTHPYNESAINTDISHQKHVKKLLSTHKPVISDVFLSVQGYYAIALHIPVFKENTFVGSIAILIPIDVIGKLFLDNLELSKNGQAWLISENHIEIYCPLAEHQGNSIIETTNDDIGTIELLKKIETDIYGTGKSNHQIVLSPENSETSDMYTVFHRVNLENTYWTILISYPENEIYLALSNFRNWLALIISALFIAVAYYLYSWAKVQNILKEEVKRRKAEKLLQESEEKFKALFISSGDASLVLKDNVIVDCNNRATKLFNAAKSRIIGDKVWSISPLNQPDGERSEEKANSLFNSALKESVIQFEWQHKRYTNELIDVEVTLSVIDKKERLLFAILRDITEKKSIQVELDLYRDNLEDLVENRTEELEKANKELKRVFGELKKQKEEVETTLQTLKDTQSQLLQAEKMASLGILTAGISHEINNPLNYLSGTYYGFEDYFKEYGSQDKEKTTLLLSSTQMAISRISEIVKGLNQFSRDNQKFDEECDIHAIIDNCLTILKSQIKHKVEIEKDYYKEGVIILGNVGKMHQVFLNIITNSIQAIEDKGKIYISTRVEGNIAKIDISDTGSGISEENILKITDPFFTTKDPGKGTGLGLSITYAILQDHKGSINFVSEINKGTTATIILPVR